MTSEFAIAVHALVYLNHKEITLASDTLAENVCTNPARIRKVMAKLKKSNLVKTKEGINGGYHMLGDAKDISLGQICRALEIEPVSVSWNSGDAEMNCQIASGMAGIMEEIYRDLNEICKKRLDKITIQDIDNAIFKSDKT
ncbi:MAG: Rrf2 family transcriptional regulator [Clostridium sp.]